AEPQGIATPEKLLNRALREREASDGVKYLTVCDLPASDRPRIMRELELMGLTYGSLFPGLDGICRDMKDRLFAAPIG
ncbi:hypothetical protein, partial [Sphingobium yanoikuyae]|uniref:hypothetical protein n=1 Tax=Sphingobium yanoikuyae TaxID=13690 RepID=UPI002FD8FB88